MGIAFHTRSALLLVYEMNMVNLVARRLSKLSLFFALLLTLAACQTTGLEKGNLQTNFAPNGWLVGKKGSMITYLCHPSKCKSPQAVIVRPIKVRGDVEKAIRTGHLRKELVDAALNVIKVATYGSYKPSKVRKITTATYSGFELVERIKGKKGFVYVATRSIIQKNRGSVVASIAYSRKAAVNNLRRFFAKSHIRR